jgi:flavin-dependent dehydrogenase
MSSERNKSIVEIGAVRAPADRYDVTIVGGGLAGLTLAIQIKQTRPETSVLVLEKREGPAPLAAFKVGESTVPSGAHYFAEVVGMYDHLKKKQLVKCGLRYFPPGDDGNRDITQRVEMGPPAYPPHDNFQIDRGLFENALAARARSLGVEVTQGSRVREVDLTDGDHEIKFEHFGNETTTSAAWVVDASGRASVLKRKLGLARDCGHHINSAWFRLGGGLDIEDWGRDDATWMGSMSEAGIRQYSTNHLLGEGYWIWMIPLSSGPISIGVCADPRYHPFDEINSFEGMLNWLRAHEPQLAASVEGRTNEIEDFLRVEDFAYGVERILSTDRWALVGEAGAFADPFYSPGSDFICFSNTFACDMITRSLDGEDISERLAFYNDLYLRAFEQVVSRYRDSYPVFGNSWVASGLLVWDFYANHTGMTLLTVTNKLTDYEFMKSVTDDLDRLFRLNINVHKLFREWNELERKSRPPAFLKTFPMLITGLLGMVKEYPDDDAIRAELHTEVTNSEALAVALFHIAAQALPDPPPADRPVNPYAVGLKPETWEADGLFGAPGLTKAEADKVASGLGSIWDDSINPFEGMSGPPPGVGGGPPPGVTGGPPPGVIGGDGVFGSRPEGGGPPGGSGGPPPGVAGGPPPGVAGPPAR